VEKSKPVGTVIESHTGPVSQSISVLTFNGLEWIVNRCVEITPALQKFIEDFWGTPVKLQFFSVSPESLYFWRLDDFYVSQLALEGFPKAPAQLRISDEACAALLTQVLGPTPHPQKGFRFNQITRFEAELLSSFSKDLFSTFRKTLLKKSPSPAKKPHLLHLIWLLNADSPEAALGTGKIILSLPREVLRRFGTDLPGEASCSSKTSLLPDTLFDHAHTLATLWLGQTKLRLEELQTLETGDIIVLQGSASHAMALKISGTGHLLPFTAEIRYRKSIEVPYTQEIENAMIDHQHTLSVKETLWDNLMIDVTAEFQPTKIPLHQLRQMSEGLVVEVGDLIHNHIRLHVEGKTVAIGELVIIGDKFGVRIKRLADGEELREHPAHHHPAVAVAQGEHHINGVQETTTLEVPPTGEAPAEALDELDEFLNDDFDSETFDDEDEDW
jgi:flagellar motor switch/type III secretory pathway protein FliN